MVESAPKAIKINYSDKIPVKTEQHKKHYQNSKNGKNLPNNKNYLRNKTVKDVKGKVQPKARLNRFLVQD